MRQKPGCYCEKVAEEFDRVARQLAAAALPSGKKRAEELAILANAIRQDCVCSAVDTGKTVARSDHASAANDHATPARRQA